MDTFKEGYDKEHYKDTAKTHEGDVRIDGFGMY